MTVSMMTPPNGFHLYATRRFGPDNVPARINKWNGDNALTLIRTENGTVVYLRFDNASPRPHRMGFYTLQGTQGSADDERGVYIDWQSKAWETFDRYYSRYDHPYWVRNSEKAKQSGHGGGDYFTWQHFYWCARESRTRGIDVYDAVTWSALTPLSADSIRQGSMPQAVPDYTSGKWKTRKRFDWATNSELVSVGARKKTHGDYRGGPHHSQACLSCLIVHPLTADRKPSKKTVEIGDAVRLRPKPNLPSLGKHAILDCNQVLPTRT